MGRQHTGWFVAAALGLAMIAILLGQHTVDASRVVGVLVLVYDCPDRLFKKAVLTGLSEGIPLKLRFKLIHLLPTSFGPNPAPSAESA